MAEFNVWRFRALFAEGAMRWNKMVESGKCTDEQRGNMMHARSWYYHRRHWMKPGQAAKELMSDKGCRDFPNPGIVPKEARSIIAWIKDLAPPEMKTKGRPRKK
jgi:hypothetical protein